MDYDFQSLAKLVPANRRAYSKAVYRCDKNGRRTVSVSKDLLQKTGIQKGDRVFIGVDQKARAFCIQKSGGGDFASRRNPVIAYFFTSEAIQ